MIHIKLQLAVATKEKNDSLTGKQESWW